MILQVFSFAAISLVFPSPHAPLLAQEKQEITVEWIYSDEGREPTKLPRFVWTESGNAILYDTRKPEKERSLEWLDPDTRERTPAIDRDEALASLSSLRQKTDGLDEEEELIDSLLWPDSFDRAGRYGVFVLEDDIFLLELESSSFHRVTSTTATEKSARFSPDGNWLAYVRDNDLYAYDIPGKAEKRLTEDGSRPSSTAPFPGSTGRRFLAAKTSDTGGPNSEAYMKTPLANPEGYEKTSLVRTAKDLHGRLLLVHGTYDDNVHPQNSWHFIDELIEAGKDFDMMMYPKRKHGISDRPARIHLYKKMVAFWKLYL